MGKAVDQLMGFPKVGLARLMSMSPALAERYDIVGA